MSTSGLKLPSVDVAKSYPFGKIEPNSVRSQCKHFGVKFHRAEGDCDRRLNALVEEVQLIPLLPTYISLVWPLGNGEANNGFY